MELPDLMSRVRRLDELSRGLAREVSIWKDCDDPLHFVERRAYLNAIHDALAGVEQARVTLARACQRIQEKQRTPPPPLNPGPAASPT